MHIAAEQGNFETLKVLLDDDRADPEVTTNVCTLCMLSLWFNDIT